MKARITCFRAAWHGLLPSFRCRVGVLRSKWPQKLAQEECMGRRLRACLLRLAVWPCAVLYSAIPICQNREAPLNRLGKEELEALGTVTEGTSRWYLESLSHPRALKDVRHVRGIRQVVLRVELQGAREGLEAADWESALRARGSFKVEPLSCRLGLFGHPKPLRKQS